jgi:3-oxoacyl-[acyl-carrier protein] reductase
MDLGLSGKVAIVAGASRGIGLGIARALCAEGAAVAMTGRRQSRLDAAVRSVVADGARAIGIQADMSRKDDVVRAVATTRDKLGAPDIAVSMSFYVVAVDNSIPGRGFENTSDDQLREGMEDIVLNIAYLAREVLPHMKEQGWGRLINIGSVAMKEPHRDDPVVLSNIRVAAAGLMKTLANEYGQFGITANVIAPGPIDTPYLGDYFAQLPEHVNTKEKWAKLVPMRRLGTEQDAGDLAAFLASDRASWITGQTILLDGGYARTLL